MELKAIIGKNLKGLKKWNPFENFMNYGDKNKIRKYMHDKGGNIINLDYTGANKSLRSLENKESLLQKFLVAKNLYIHVSNLKDPLGFYQFLSENNFILKDSKLKYEYQE